MRTASNRISTVVTGVAALAAVTALGACSNSATKEASSPASSPPAATQNQTQAADNITKVHANSVSIPFSLANLINSKFSVPGLKMIRFGCKPKM